jgi:hypothetical protein
VRCSYVVRSIGRERRYCTNRSVHADVGGHA